MLIERLEAQFGVRDSALSWLRSYLSGRQQFVKLGQHSSNIMPCDCGIPQGSVLGPLLFTTYVAPVSELIRLVRCVSSTFRRRLASSFSDYGQMDVFTSAKKVPSTSKFWDKDVSKRPEFPESRPKFERWTKRLAATT